jgi:DNA-binding CsgD family transcriptional regulator
MHGWVVANELRWVTVPYRTERIDERRALAVEAADCWTRGGGALSDLVPRLARLPLLLLEGGDGWAEVRALSTELLGGQDSGAVAAWWRLYLASALGQVAREQDDAALAWTQVHTGLPAGPATSPGDVVHIDAQALQRLAATLACDAGDFAGAHAWLTAHDRWLAWSDAILGQAESQLGWAAYHRVAGDPALAERAARRALGLATEPRQPLALLAAHRLLGELATDAGRYDVAMSHLGEALSLADACAAPYERALTLQALAAMRRATGQRAAIEPLVTEVRAICVPLGARRALALADGVAPRSVAPLPGGLPDGLTSRELEVLRFIAAGQDNQQIADELYLSVRTVERHINSLYRKIGARGRTDATAYAARQGIISA